MGKRLAFAAVAVVLVFAGAQLIRPAQANPPIQATHTLEARLGATSPVVPVLYRACGDCHSNRTQWRGPARIAPLSWLMASAVGEGRRAVNFSEWAGYPADQQRALLAQSCQDATAGKMPPGVFTSLRPEARLSARDVQVICAAAAKV